jgi:cytidylate kinase
MVGNSLQERQAGGIAVEPVEYRMLLTRILERVAGERELTERPKLGPYLTISREAGSGGTEIAEHVASTFEWKVLDRELVEDLAHRLELEPRLLELMDETRVGWFSETLLNLFNSRLLLQNSFVSMISSAIALAAEQGRVVIVGRAGNLVLPRDGGLRVRVIAPRDLRLAALARHERLAAEVANRRLDELDENRKSFVRRHFHCDPSDPRHYDLVINSAAFGVEGSAELICWSLEHRGLAG